MKIIKNKFFLLIPVFLLSVFLSGIIVFFVSAQEKSLEIQYPETSGFQPTTTKTALPDYIKYIFNFIIAITGIIGLIVLSVGGFRFLFSAESPSLKTAAAKQMIFGFLGMLILLFSYIIFTTINPQLTKIKISSFPKPKEISITLPEPAPAQDKNPFARINEIVGKIGLATASIEQLSKELKTLVENCDCQATLPFCLCRNYMGSCQFQYCYIGTSHPCPDIKKIRETEQKIIAFQKEILYYKNEILAERNDLLFEIEEQLKKEFSYLETRINAEKEALAKIAEKEKIAKENQEKLIAWLEQEKEKLEMKIELKDQTAKNIWPLSKEIEKLSQEISVFPGLTDQCETNVRQKCQGGCTGGCHDTDGCFPEGNCSGGNPCNINEFQNVLDKINQPIEEISQISDNINGDYQGHEFVDQPLPPIHPGPIQPTPSGCPQGWRFQKGIEKQCSHISPFLWQLLDCMRQKLPAGIGEISSISDSRIFNNTCNWCDPDDGTPGKCAHCCRGNNGGSCKITSISAHYGSQNCRGSSYAVDLGDEQNYFYLRKAAQECKASFINFEGNHIHIDIAKQSGCKI